MQIPLQITFEGGLAGSDSLRQRIQREAAKLERFYDRISSCRVAVIGRGGKSRQGGLYAVRLQLAAAGLGEVVVTRNPPADHAHEDAFVAVRDAFAAARRKLQDRTSRRSGKVKAHEPPLRGEIVGFIRDADQLHDDEEEAFAPRAAGGRLDRIAYV